MMTGGEQPPWRAPCTDWPLCGIAHSGPIDHPWDIDCGGKPVDLFLAYYAQEREGAELVHSANRLADGKSWTRLELNLPTVAVHDLRVKDDDLVVGTHGRTGVARALLGSIAEDLLSNPPCDVLAVKAW